MTQKKPFVKINIEDLEYAKEFFDNIADYSIWLYAVTEYYCGNEVQIKKKIVKKYFDNYKKTMNIVIEAKEFGKKGALKRIEKQQVNIDTLEATLQHPLKDTLAVNNKIVNNKEENIYKSFKHLSISVDEFNKLSIDYTKRQIDDILEQIENNANNKKYTSLYLTAKNWLKRNEPNEEKIIDPLVEYVNKQLGL